MFIKIQVLLVVVFALISSSIIQAADSEPSTYAVETFTVDGVVYEVPAQWRGKRIIAPAPGEMIFAKIPSEHCHNGSSVYITEEANNALKKMLQAAKDDNIMLMVESGYRSYGYQKKIFSKLMNKGRSYDDIIRYVAPPGYSQHSLGTAVDFYPSDWQFADLPAYTWLKENAGAFGFYESYPERNREGYPWEAWHWNYTGVTTQ